MLFCQAGFGNDSSVWLDPAEEKRVGHRDAWASVKIRMAVIIVDSMTGAVE